MDWLFDFQRSLRDPVFGVLGAVWPFLLIVGLGALLFWLGWYVSNQMRHRRGRERHAGDNVGDVTFSVGGSGRSHRDDDTRDSSDAGSDSGGGGDGGGGGGD